MSEEKAPECRRCQTRMDRGFVLDLYGCTNESWIPGDPETGRFGVIIKIRRRPHYPIVTFRCPQCGLLESYAPGQA